MSFTEQWQQDEFMKCAKSFEYFASNYVEIRSLEAGSVKFEMYEYQKRVLKEFSQHRFNIIRKFRQGGLTTMAVVWSLWLCMFRKHKQILIISKTDLEAIKAGKTARKAVEYLRDSHPWLAPQLATDSKHVMTFIDTKSELEFGSTKRARGQALNYVIIDEAAFIPNMEETWADMYPTIATGGNVIIISTVNGMGNWYQKMYYDAESESNGFNVIDLHYTEHPKYRDPQWAAEARANLGDRLFAQEILGSFLESGETFIPQNILSVCDYEARNKTILKKLFAEWESYEPLVKLHGEDFNIDHNWNKGALWVWHEPVDGHEYIIGVDVAEGVGSNGDNSTFQIIDIATMEQVAEFCSNIIPPNEFSMILARIGIYYNNALVVVENAGPGCAVLDKLQHNLYYENIYYQRTRSTDKAGVTNNKSTRPLMLEAMQNYMQQGIVKISSHRLVSELQTFIFKREKKRAEASGKNHDDLVMAFALALYIRDIHLRDVPMGIEMPANMIDSPNSIRYESIRREIEESSDEDDSLLPTSDPTSTWDLEDILPGVIMPYKRNNDSLLKEFGW